MRHTNRRAPSLSTIAALLAGAVAALAPFAATGPALAQESPRAYYGSLPSDTVRGIEYDLIWVGATDAVTNGAIGPTDIDSIRDFEARNGLRADGILGPRERGVLARQAGRARAQVGYEIVRNQRVGARIGLPTAFVGEPTNTPTTTEWRSADDRLRVLAYRLPGQGLDEAYRDRLSRAGREVTYDVLRDDFFVIAGKENGLDLYIRGEEFDGEVRAIAVVYDTALSDAIEPMIVAMSNDFEPFSIDTRPAPPPVVPPASPCISPYAVRPGDTLYAIALRCSTTVPAIARANPTVDPFALRVGQRLLIPNRGDAFPPPPPPAPPPARPPVQAVVAELSSTAPQQGGSLDVTARGFRPGEVVEAGFGRTADRFVVTRIVRADGSGTVRLTMRLPDDYRAGDGGVVAFATPDGARGAATPRFTVRAVRPPARRALTVTGMLTTEGTRCTALRDVDGALYTLTGRLPDYAAGTPVRVDALAGTEAQGAQCAQGRTIEVQSMARR